MAAAARPEGWDAIAAVLDEALDAEAREVIVRRYLDGQEQAAIATALGVSQATVSRRIAAALETLRGRMRVLGLVIGPLVLAEGLEAHASPAVPAQAVEAAARLASPAGASGRSTRRSLLRPPMSS